MPQRVIRHLSSGSHWQKILEEIERMPHLSGWRSGLEIFFFCLLRGRISILTSEVFTLLTHGAQPSLELLIHGEMFGCFAFSVKSILKLKSYQNSIGRCGSEDKTES